MDNSKSDIKIKNLKDEPEIKKKPNSKKVRFSKTDGFWGLRKKRLRFWHHRKTGLFKAEEAELKADRAQHIDTDHLLSYLPYISKIGHLATKGDIPVPATDQDRNHKGSNIYRKLAKLLPWNWKKKEDPNDIHESDSEDEVYDPADKLWPTTRLSKMAFIALIFNANNVLSFPSYVYKHGGIVFILVYFVMTMMIVQPIIYLEMLLGQFAQSGVTGLSRYDIYSDAFIIVFTIMCFIFVPYNEIELGYIGAYLVDAFRSDLDDSHTCSPEWNQLDSCIQYDYERYEEISNNHSKHPPEIFFDNGTVRTSFISNELYFRQAILQQPWHALYNEYKLNVTIGLGFSMSYILVFLAIQSNLTSRFAQITIYASTLLPFGLVVLLVSQFTWPGAVDGVKYMVQFQWARMESVAFWSDAIRHTFKNFGIGYGFYLHLSTRNPSSFTSFWPTSVLICFLETIFCIISSLILYTELGIVKHYFQADSFEKLFAETAGLGFISLTGALLKLNEDWAPSIFYIIICLFGIWKQAVATEICTAMLIGFMPFKKYVWLVRRISLFIVILVQAFWAASLFHIYPYILESANLFGGTWAASIIVLSEVFITVYLYGFHLMMIDIEIILHYSVPTTFYRRIKYVVPVFLSIGILCLTGDIIARPNSFYLKVIRSPDWLVVLGIFLNLIPVITLCIVMYYAYWKRKVALSRKLGDVEKNEEGKTRRYDLAYRRLLNRRMAIFGSSNEGAENMFSEKNVDCLNQRRKMQLALKDNLRCLMRRQLIKASWQRCINKVLLGIYRVNTIMRLINFAIRECDRRHNIKEARYLQEVIRKCSLENIFTSCDLSDCGNPEVEYGKFITGALESVPATLVANVYKPLTPFQLLTGRRIPTPEEEKQAMIIRVKRHLLLPYRRDIIKHRKLVRQGEEEANRDSIFKEDAPHEFFSEMNDGTIMRIIVVKGGDHSLIRSLPHPRPPILRMQDTSVAGGDPFKTMKNIQERVDRDWTRLSKELEAAATASEGQQTKATKSISYARDTRGQKTNLPDNLPRQLSQPMMKAASVHNLSPIDLQGVKPQSFLRIPGKIRKFSFGKVKKKVKSDEEKKETAQEAMRRVKLQVQAMPPPNLGGSLSVRHIPSSVNETMFLHKPMAFERWHFGAGTHPYHVTTDRTYIVVLMDAEDILRKNKYRWLQKRRSRKVWPDYYIEKNKHKRQTYNVNFQELFRYDQVVAERERMLNAPDDITFKRPGDLSSDSDESSLSKASTTSVSKFPSSISLHDSERRLAIVELGVSDNRRNSRQKSLEGRTSRTSIGLLYQSSQTSLMADEEEGNQLSPKTSATAQYGFVEQELHNRVSIPTIESTLLQSEERRTSMSENEKKNTKSNFLARRQALVREIDIVKLAKVKSLEFEHFTTLGARGRRKAEILEATPAISLRNVDFEIDPDEEIPVKDTLSLKAIWSQESLSNKVDHGDDIDVLQTYWIGPGKVTRAMWNWNDSEKFAYRSQGNTLIIDKNNEFQPFNWAKSGDSIASLEDAEDEPSDRKIMASSSKNREYMF